MRRSRRATRPDVFRVPYYTLGGYAGRGQLLDLTPHLEAGFVDRFTEAAWSAVQNDGKPFGVPHHTDTSAILYNKNVLASAGITSVPTEVEQAWTWDEFGEVASTLRKALAGHKYPFAYNWKGDGVPPAGSACCFGPTADSSPMTSSPPGSTPPPAGPPSSSAKASSPTNWSRPATR